jgi:AraC-like DNA-binding protein
VPRRSRGRRSEQLPLADPAERDRSVSEIAYHWGFNDAAHFSRTFKARFGMSPRDARSV